MENIRTKKVKNLVIAYSPQRIGREHSEELEKSISSLVRRNRKSHLLLNMEETVHVNSSGVNSIINVMKALKATERKMRICCTSEQIYNLFNVVNLGKFIEIVETEEEAIELFNKDKSEALQTA